MTKYQVQHVVPRLLNGRLTWFMGSSCWVKYQSWKTGRSIQIRCACVETGDGARLSAAKTSAETQTQRIKELETRVKELQEPGEAGPEMPEVAGDAKSSLCYEPQDIYIYIWFDFKQRGLD